MATNNAPAAPAISTDLNVTVSIHHSHQLAPNNEHGSGRHLASVGRPLLEAAHIAALSGMYDFQGIELENYAKSNLAQFVNKWVTHYGWRENVSATHTVPPGVNLNDPEETRYLFDVYVGAVRFQHGNAAVFAWIAALLRA